MLAYASSVLSARSCAAAHDAVATFGKVLVTPNGANAIPSAVRAWLDARAADEADADHAGGPDQRRGPRPCHRRRHRPRGERRVGHSRRALPGGSAGAAAAGAGASRRHPGAADAGRARRRHPVGAGSDGNAVRAQPHRGVALADGVRRERRLQPRRAGAGRRDGRLGAHRDDVQLVVRTCVARRQRRRSRADLGRRRPHHRHRDRRRPAAVVASACRAGAARSGQRPLARLSPGAAGAHPKATADRSGPGGI